MKKQKRTVVIIGSAYPLRGGGIATYNERLAKAFSDHGDDIQIQTFKLQYPGIFFPGKTQYSEELPPEGLDIKVTVNSINPFNWIKVGRALKRLRPDLVIVRYWIPFMAPCLGSISRIIKSNKHTRIIAIADNIIPHERKISDRLLTGYFVKSVHAFITMSRSVMKDLEFFDKENPKKYCPHPLYDNFGDIISKKEAKRMLNLDESGNFILFFGFIRDYKGLDILLKAFADKRLKDYSLKLLVAGEFYTDPEPYNRIIEQHGLIDRVIMLNDFIPNIDVGKYFCASDLVVQPYKEATQSGVTQVAYHFNKPIITTDVGGLAEIVPDGKVGYVVPPQPDRVADAIYKFYNEEKENLFATNIKEEKKKYSWDNMIKTIYELFEETKLTYDNTQ
ncbi:MAG: glycosyltransferase [Bacteroidales bacterium]|nr:glycosyltransferase [Bacteroidales bacterium]